MADEEPKIFIDEGWKAQVQREKELARQRAQENPSAEATPLGATATGAETSPAVEEDEEPTMYVALLSSLAAQAMYALGMIGSPDQKQVMVDVVQAKYVIDTLMMLRDKTKGNLTPEEQASQTEILAELQRLYVYRAQQVQEQAMKQSGIDLGKLRQ